MKKLSIHALYIIAVVSLSPPVVAAPVCNVATTGITFSALNPLDTAAETTLGVINLKCSGGPVSYTISLSAGNGSLASRKMLNEGNNLNYNIFTSSSNRGVLGDGSLGSAVITGSSASPETSVAYTIYGTVLNKGFASSRAGVFGDNITINLAYQ